MAKKAFDPSKYEYSKSTDRLYIKGGREVTNPKIIKQYKISKGLIDADNVRSYTNLKVPEKYNKLFGRSGLHQANGKIIDSARPLAYRGGKNPEYGWRRANFWGTGSDGKPKLMPDSSSRRWGANLNQMNRKDLGKSQAGKGAVLMGSKEWVRQIQISIYQLGINAERFRVIVGKRALQVFRESFKYKQFWSTGSTKWPSLAPYTLKKRAKRGTGSSILREYGDLYNSIQIDENAKGFTRIYTKPVAANQEKHKKRTICYAGYHNDPRPGDVYGRSGTPYKRRQFMGHSDKIDTFALSVMKRYLFDDVFLIKKV